MTHLVLVGDPVILELALPNLLENSIDLDTENYPFVGGTSPELAGKTVRISAMEIFTGAAAGNILDYVKLDGEYIWMRPIQTGSQEMPSGAGQTTYLFTMKELFGRDYIPLRSTVAAKLSADAGHDAIVYLYGLALAGRTE